MNILVLNVFLLLGVYKSSSSNGSRFPRDAEGNPRQLLSRVLGVPVKPPPNCDVLCCPRGLPRHRLMSHDLRSWNDTDLHAQEIKKR